MNRHQNSLDSSKTLKLMIECLKNEKSLHICNSNNIKLNEDIFYKLVTINKLDAFLEDFGVCTACGNKLSQYFKHVIQEKNKQRFILRTLYYIEKKTIETILTKNKILFVFIKDFSHFGKKFKDIYSRYIGADLDLLVHEQDLIKVGVLLNSFGYKVLNNAPQEVTYVNIKTRYTIDVHFFPSIPRKNFISEKKLKDFSHTLLENIVPWEGGNYLKPEYLLLNTIISFVSNEFFHGLKSLYYIFYISKYYYKKINWQLFFSLGDYLYSKQVFLLTILVSWKIFSKNSIDSIINDLPINLKLLLQCLNKEYIADYSLPDRWWDDNDTKSISYRNERYSTILLASEHLSFLKSLKPNIIWFFLKSYFRK